MHMDIVQWIYKTIVNLKINSYLWHTTYVRTYNSPFEHSSAAAPIEAIPFTLVNAIPFTLDFIVEFLSLYLMVIKKHEVTNCINLLAHVPIFFQISCCGTRKLMIRRPLYLLG